MATRKKNTVSVPTRRTAPGTRTAKTTTTRKTPVRDRGFNRAESLLAAALDLFATRNFADVTIKDIGNATGANTALIYYYFASKEDLFRATIEAAVERAFKHFRLLRERRTTPPEIIAGWLENHLELYDMICKLVRICIDYASTSKRQVAIDRSISRFYDEERAVLSSAIRMGIEQKLFQPADADQLALFVSTYLDGDGSFRHRAGLRCAGRCAQPASAVMATAWLYAGRATHNKAAPHR